MASPQDSEKQFDRLLRESVEDYELGLDRLNEKQAYAEARSRRRLETARMQLSLAGVNEQQLEELQTRDEEDLDHYLEHIKPKLAARALNGASSVRVMRAREALAHDTRSTVIRPYGAIALAPEAKWIEGIEGKVGNPWIVPDNPETVNMSQWSRGGGLGNCLGGPDYTEDGMVRYDVFFEFVPDRTATWELTAVVTYSGFWILRAHDGYFSCKNAGVLLRTDLDVYQYFWTGPERLVLVDKEHAHIEDEQFVDVTPFQWMTARLRAGDPVWIRARIEMVAYAAGAGSYAEINFWDGVANYIRPLIVSATPV
jgi:hypothetical protein